MDSSNTMVAEANSPAECDQIIHHLRQQNPYEQYTIEEFHVSSVRSGFGRDPDLHWLNELDAHSCYRFRSNTYYLAWIKCEALTFHVDCLVRRNLTAGSIIPSFMWVRTAEIGSRYLTLLLGSDLSQPTSTSRKICKTALPLRGFLAIPCFVPSAWGFRSK